MKEDTLTILSHLNDDGEYEWGSINEMREAYGLPALRPGQAKCLKCDGVFGSWDVTMNRVCPECSYENTELIHETDCEGETIYKDDINYYKIDHGIGPAGHLRPKATDGNGHDNR